MTSKDKPRKRKNDHPPVVGSEPEHQDDEDVKLHGKFALLSEHTPQRAVFAWTPTSVLLFVIVLVSSVTTRLWKVDLPREVLFDEVHFVGFAQDYAAGRPVFDIHPPLSKLMLAAVVKLSGFHTNVPYKEIGTEYKHDGYIWMRTVQALFGSTLAVFAFLSVRELGGSVHAAFFSGMLLVLELSLQTISRAVFMDPFLYACIALGFYGALRTWRTNNDNSNNNSTKAWLHVLFWAWVSGVGMGSAFSTKHTGLGVIGVVGTVHLVKTFGPMLRGESCSESVWLSTKRLFYSGVVMVFMIISVYVGSFIIHFKLGGERINPKHSMLWNVYDVNRRMVEANQRSVFHHHHGSQWQEWPVLYRGLVYWWKHLPDGRHLCVYLFGNPIVYWLVLLVLLVSIYVVDKKIWNAVVERHEMGAATRDRFTPVLLCLFGWMANYLPYPLFIKRTCFVYHYHPSLYFGIILCGVFLDYATHALQPKQRSRARTIIAGAILTVALITYVYYLPFSYALPLSDEEHEDRRKMYFFPIFRQIFPIW